MHVNSLIPRLEYPCQAGRVYNACVSPGGSAGMPTPAGIRQTQTGTSVHARCHGVPCQSAGFIFQPHHMLSSPCCSNLGSSCAQHAFTIISSCTRTYLLIELGHLGRAVLRDVQLAAPAALRMLPGAELPQQHCKRRWQLGGRACMQAGHGSMDAPVGGWLGEELRV